MTDEMPREYDHEFMKNAPGPARRRLGFDVERGDVTRFALQLEYHHAGAWRPVVRYDHDGTGESEHAHDVTEDGLHIDIYRDGEKHATEYIAPPRPADKALARAEDHFTQNAQRFINRYEQWHEIKSR